MKLLSFGSDDQANEEEVLFTKKPMFRPERALILTFVNLIVNTLH